MRAVFFFRRLAQYDWLALVALAPVVVYAERVPPWLTGVVVALMFLTWFARRVTMGYAFTRTTLNIPLLCLMLTVPLGLYATANLADSWPFLVRLLFGVAVYFVAVRASADARTLPFALSVWLLCVFAIALLALVSVDWVTIKFPLLTPLATRLPRLFSGLGSRAGQGLNPNVVGGTLALFAPSLVAALWLWRAPRTSTVWFDPMHRVGRVVWLVALFIVGGLLVLTQSRSALFGVGVAVVVLLAAQSRSVRWLALVACIVAIIGALVVGPSALGNLLLGDGGTSVGSLNFAERQEVWSRALYAIQDFPFTGVGLNQFEAVARLLYPFFLAGPDAQVSHAHNDYLQTAVDFGLGGLVAYAALLSATAIVVVRAYRASSDARQRLLLLGFACGLLAFQIFGLSDAIPLGARTSFVWWLTLGMLHGLCAQADAKPMRGLRVTSRDVVLLWLLASLVAIAFVGDEALLGVGLAVVGGGVVGVAARLQYEATSL